MPGDFVVDVSYQHVEPQSVPDFDSLGGAGRGNLTNVPGVIDATQGNNNYKGARFQAAYCLTPDVLVNLKGVYTTAAASKLVPSSMLHQSARTSNNTWKSLALELVYSF